MNSDYSRNTMQPHQRNNYDNRIVINTSTLRAGETVIQEQNRTI